MQKNQSVSYYGGLNSLRIAQEELAVSGGEQRGASGLGTRWGSSMPQPLDGGVRAKI